MQCFLEGRILSCGLWDSGEDDAEEEEFDLFGGGEVVFGSPVRVADLGFETEEVKTVRDASGRGHSHPHADIRRDCVTRTLGWILWEGWHLDEVHIEVPDSPQCGAGG